jgi:hypothetical protein
MREPCLSPLAAEAATTSFHVYSSISAHCSDYLDLRSVFSPCFLPPPSSRLQFPVYSFTLLHPCEAFSLAALPFFCELLKEQL